MPTSLTDTVIISDTSCIIALSRIDRLDILSQLFPHILITPEVETEFGKALPAWIKVQRGIDEKQKEKLQLLVDLGEASAIALALERKNCILIIDEKKGRKLAESLI
jgi:predicted nucleic acid-binding protein